VKLRGQVPFRLICQAPGDGQENMAVDEALAAGAGEGLSPPTLRLYGFSPPTLSVGRFQRARALVDPARLAAEGITLVRRPTGGQAVLHDRELTYSVVLGREHLEPFSKREIYQFIAGLLLSGLEALGIRGQSSRAALGSPHNPDCFRSTGQYEIADAAHRKLIGSAQVVTRGFSLQHGAIPLDGSYRRIQGYLRTAAGQEHGLPSSLGEELGREVSYEEAAAALARGARYALERQGLTLQPGELTAEERERAAALLAAKYSRDEWNLQY
jgi:lipoate-protein ligase A